MIVVPTPGLLGHVSVLVRTEWRSYFLVGEASYTERTLRDRISDGVTSDPRMAIETLERIFAYSRIEPIVYLPGHDPESVHRLEIRKIVTSVY